MRDVKDSGRGLAGNVPALWQEIQRIPRASDVSVSLPSFELGLSQLQERIVVS
jgi:hypothetical protein